MSSSSIPLVPSAFPLGQRLKSEKRLKSLAFRLLLGYPDDLSAWVVEAPQKESNMIPRAADIETRLREHYGDGVVYHTRQVTQELAAHFKLTPRELAESDGSHPRFAHKVHSALGRHRSLGLLVRQKRGSFRYVPEKLAEYEPHHHPPRAHKPRKALQHETVAEAIRRLKRKRRAITLAIRELEKGSS
jgi:hypothetical protein